MCELLEAYVHKGHAGLKAEKEGTLAQETADTAEVAADKAKMDMYNNTNPFAYSRLVRVVAAERGLLCRWTVKIEAADKDMTGKFSVYVVEVWGESKRLAVTHRRYGQGHARNSPSTRRRRRCSGTFVSLS